ncbi:MAG: hypothetical protein LBE08_13900, partial [Bifidobacteriaceae bacterium]|jgi:alcohol dehydrogenase|nr:hypothetical protein [Bifidobacteriaceae bacterium]
MPIDRLWIENITMTMGLVDAVTAPMLIELIEAGKLNVRPLATHRFQLGEMLQAYEVFGKAATHDALKVVIKA